MASAIGKHPVWFGIKPKLRRRVKEGLEKVSAAHLWQKRIGELSGGELQRVLLAMAMIPPPDLLLLDEPVSGVDAGGLSLFYQMVNNMRLWHDMSVIMVTHDLGGVAPHADRIILLNRTILTQGKPEDVLRDEKMVKTFGATLRA
jgi:zinc transport system ATP-binding protein